MVWYVQCVNKWQKYWLPLNVSLVIADDCHWLFLLFGEKLTLCGARARFSLSLHSNHRQKKCHFYLLAISIMTFVCVSMLYVCVFCCWCCSFSLDTEWPSYLLFSLSALSRLFSVFMVYARSSSNEHFTFTIY